MIKPFHFLVKSVTEFAAAKAALAQHGITATIGEVISGYALKEGRSATVGNYSSSNGKFTDLQGNGSDICFWGYSEKPYGDVPYLSTLTELIAFLESGDYKEKPKKFKVALAKVEIVEVEAFTEDEAKAKALQTKFPVIKTSTNVEIAR